MISFTVTTVFICGVAFADGGEALARLLGQKDKHFPYAAEYTIAFPAAPTALGRNVTLRFYGKNRTALYSEERAATYTSRLLIENGQALWEYDDKGSGVLLFKGPVDVKNGTVSAFLERQGFACNVFKHVDESICGQIKDWLQHGQVTRRDDKEVIEGTSVGAVEIHSTSSDFTVRTTGDKGATLFRYRYDQDKTPEWVDAGIDSLRKEFNNADKKFIICVESSDEFSYIELIGAALTQGAVRPIPADSLTKVARDIGYYLPKLGEIVSAEGVATGRGPKQLCLTIRDQKKEYIVVQMKPAIKRKDLPEGYVKQSRKSANYDVLEVHDAGTHAYLTYYLGGDVAFIVTGDFFNDANLERIIRSFDKPGK